MALGARDTGSLVMLTGWDATELKNFDLQNNTQFAQVVSMMNGALGAISTEMATDPLWAGLASFTDIPEVSYRVGSSNGFARHTEYGRPDNQRAAVEGHMLPLASWDRALGWTWDYLRQARMDQIEADIADAVKDVRDLWRTQLLTRVLKRGDDSGVSLGLGSGGYSPGFATTAGSTSVDFLPPTYAGTSFATTHEHYVGIGGGVFTAAVFTDAKDELREHGHEGPYEFVIGTADETAVRALTGFVETASNLITYGAMQDLAQLNGTDSGNGTYYIGMIHDFKVRVVRGIPQYYGFGWKSYGPNSQRNPLRVRLPKGTMRPAVMAMPDPNGGSGFYPVQGLQLFTEFGVGVADRTNGTARYVNNATWTDGTPT